MKKRKFFSFMLMGLLTLGATSMVTSCKDYDDDINNLQDEQAQLTSQINTLQSTLSSVQSAAASHASQADLTALQGTVSSLGSQVTTAINNAASAQEAATAAQNAVNALEAQIPDVSGFATKAELANYVTATALNEQLETFKQEIQNANKEQLDQIKSEVAKYTNTINSLYTAVTSVSLVGTISGSGDNLYTGGANGYEVDFHASEILAGSTTDFVFGKDETSGAPTKVMKGAADPTVTFEHGKTATDNTDLVIRVSPTNATITPGMIKFIDSKGNDLSKVVTVSSVERYNELITRASNTGLWRVKVQLASGIKDVANRTYAAAKGTTGKEKLYAVAVNNTPADTTYTNAADRYVVSTYDLWLGTITALPVVDDLNYVQVYNKTTPEDGRDSKFVKDTKGVDFRTSYKAVAANNGDSIVVDFSATQLDAAVSEITESSANAAGKYNLLGTKNPTNVDYFYVIRDDDYATASGSSELNAWASYKYGGDLGYANVNHEFIQKATMVKVNKGTGVAKFSVDLNGLQSGDEIGFRIFAVNYNGKLVNNTGYSFVVYVADKSSQITVNGTMRVTSSTASSNTTIAPLTSAANLKGALSNLPSSVTFKQTDGDDITFNVAYYEDAAGTVAASEIGKANYVKYTLATDPSKWKDGSTLTKTENTRNTTNGNTENVIQYSITKTLPDLAYTQEHYGYTWRSGQPKNPYVAFMQPATIATTTSKGAIATVSSVNWNAAYTLPATATTKTAAANAGTTDLDQPLDGLTAGTNITVQNTLYNNEEGKEDYVDPFTAQYTGTGSHWTVNVAEPLFKDGKSVAKNATIQHTYTGISSEKEGTTADGTIKDHNLSIVLDNFTVVYACPLDVEYTQVGDAFGTYTTGSESNRETHRVDLLYYGDDNASNGTPATSDAANTKYQASKGLLDYGTVTFTSNAAKTALGFTVSQTVTLKELLAKYNSSNVSYQVLSDENNNADYFTAGPDATLGVKFTSIVGKQAPEADVPSHLVITAKDVFGHTNTYKVAMTVKGSNSAKRK